MNSWDIPGKKNFLSCPDKLSKSASLKNSWSIVLISLEPAAHSNILLHSNASTLCSDLGRSWGSSRAIWKFGECVEVKNTAGSLPS